MRSIRIFSATRVPSVWLLSKYLAQGFEPSDPVSHTGLYRVCKSISCEALTFAYSANSIVLCDSYSALCRLGSQALASIGDLTVMHDAWTAENEQEGRAWEKMMAKSVGSKCLRLDLHADMLLEAVLYLSQFFTSWKPDEHRPTFCLELYVWERHFAYDPVDCEFSRSLELLQGTYQRSLRAPKFVHPGERVSRLPSYPNNII